MSFAEVRLGVLNPNSIAPVMPLPQRLDIAAAQGSAVGMRVAEIAPGARVELLNCHPQLSTWAFALSAEVPTMALQMPDRRPISIQPRIRTLLIEPELDRVCVVWVGEQREPTPIGPGKRQHMAFGVQWAG